MRKASNVSSGNLHVILFLCALRITISLVGIAFPSALLTILLKNPEKRPYSPTSTFLARWAFLLYLTLSFFEYRSLKQAMKPDASPKDGNNRFIRSAIECFLVADIGTIVLLIILMMTQPNSNKITCIVLYVFLSLGLATRSNWITQNPPLPKQSKHEISKRREDSSSSTSSDSSSKQMEAIARPAPKTEIRENRKNR
ncbi:uncharacterized protein MONOS_14629 [Monocercomonoides exilis]|uniref:uncharacterized protein n=1 Tax=Monocercomonoides exilis TaxID=2049356 RepID=UPI0035598158|nr:hypothetical protein MONOS_14629 [Monocercomonoides exilis]|eukprot:MONOS_14629.1-p1 / transcript=MONOS_14629.1 / gene=MONOS_14629 / organism=Monocercomonoides_exilis_PA203 / gene_product=unspecified product / transcript_product=unspecified product / location=Mono_scaffold01037:10898-11543(+) / protein_length=198 / sequence_SO=supercontig / SO=protein_coding / is_pseudo=false